MIAGPIELDLVKLRLSRPAAVRRLVDIDFVHLLKSVRRLDRDAGDQPCCCLVFGCLADPLTARWIIPTTSSGAVISDAWSTLAD